MPDLNSAKDPHSDRNNLSRINSASSPVFVLDIDGVVTSPLSKQVNPEVIQACVQHLRSGGYLAFNTGRSLSWAREHVLDQIQKQGSAHDLDRVFLCAEKGLISLFFRDGQELLQYSTEFAVQNPIKQDVRVLIASMGDQPFFLDESKQLMVSIEFRARPGHDINHEFELFKGIQPVLAAKLEERTKNFEPGKGAENSCWRVDQTSIAIDLEHRSAGKDLGARNISLWLERNLDDIPKLISIGDSPSDRAMHDAFLKSPLVKDAEFHFVGSASSLNALCAGADISSGSIRIAPDGFDLATARILRENLQPQTSLADLISPTRELFATEQVRVLGLFNSVSVQAISDPYKDPEHYPVTAQALERYQAALSADRLKWQGYADVEKHLLQYERLLAESKSGDRDSKDVLVAAETALSAIDRHLGKRLGKYGLLPLEDENSFEVKNGVFRARTFEVPMVRYLEFARKGVNEETLRFSRVTGACSVLQTPREADFEHGFLIVQLRNAEKNSPYGGIPGAGIAGYLTAQPADAANSKVQAFSSLQSGNEPRIRDINNELLFEAIQREGREELGLAAGQMDDFKVLGLSEDILTPHYEFGLSAKTLIPFSKLAERGARHTFQLLQKDHNVTHPHDFGEHFIGIPATPAAVLTLLSEGPPLPPTHLASYAMWGYQRMLDLSGDQSTAAHWLENLSKAVGSHHQELGSKVYEFYRTHPERYFLACSHKELLRLEEFSKSFEKKTAGELSQIIAAHDTPGQVWGWLEQASKSKPLPEAILKRCAISAIAMQRGIIVAPQINSYDSYRTPENQGLEQQQKWLARLEERFEYFHWGTKAAFQNLLESRSA